MNLKKKKIQFGANQLKGNWGEQYIASKLTACECLVRNVTGGHDSGIDLYCESIRKGYPYLHFFVQVKTSNKYKPENTVCTYIEKSESRIKYWKRQPVPVFIFLVPDGMKTENVPYFICSVLDFSNNNKTIDSRIKISNSSGMNTFFFDGNDRFGGLLIEETFNWSLSKGHLSPLPINDESSLSWFPEGVMISPENQNKVSNTLHNSLWRLCEDLLKDFYDLKELRLKEGKNQDDLLKYKPFFYALEILLGVNSNANTSRITIGLWHGLNSNYGIAEEWINEGIEITKININNFKDGSDKDHLRHQLQDAEKHLETIRRVRNNLKQQS